MNDQQFNALLSVFQDIAEELLFIRDEISGLRNLYAQANGFESDSEMLARIDETLKSGKIFDNLEE